MISDEQAEQFVKALHEKTQRDQEPKTIVLKKTDRGFLWGEFDDLSGAQCKISKSSPATDDAIWLGVDITFQGKETVNALMQLNKQMVQALLPLLTKFAETGELTNLNTIGYCPACGEWWEAEHHRVAKFCPFCCVEMDTYDSPEPSPECVRVGCFACGGLYGIPFFDWWLTCHDGCCPYCGVPHKQKGDEP